MTSIRATTRQLLGTTLTMGAAGAAGWFVTLQIAEPVPPQPTAQISTAPATHLVTPAAAGTAPQHFERVGQVTATSPHSLTTVNAQGESTTFRITPDTTRIGQSVANGTVVVVGIVQNGVPVATAIADTASIGPDGPPMDYDLPT